jgi:hypothetical protein
MGHRFHQPVKINKGHAHGNVSTGSWYGDLWRRPLAVGQGEELVLSYVAGEGSPEGFYRRLGFEPTGEEIEGEVVMGLRVTDRSGKTIE